MARRKKGKPVHGWLIIDKPVGAGSTQMVSKARWAFEAQKAGHAGTLDPLASGVLAIAFGEATKTVPYVMDGPKRYRFTVRWGEATATDDREGEVIAQSDARPDTAQIEQALGPFRGDILQVPPLISAVKVDGQRAYHLARAGEMPELAARPLRVDRLELVDTPDADHAVFDMICGKGGYVRSIARDLGEALGCHGHVSALRRTATGPFSEEDAIDPVRLDAVRAGEDFVALIPVAAALEALPRVDVAEEGALRIRHGNPAQVFCNLAYGNECWAAFGEEPIAIGLFKAGYFHAKRVLLATEPLD